MRKPFSVVDSDKHAITNLISIHASPEPRILDATCNQGRIWRGLPYRPHRSDIDPQWQARGLADTVADLRALPFDDGSFDVEIIDVPHVEDAGNMATDYVQDFGLDMLDGPVIELFKPALIEAKRVLVNPHGIVLFKIIDYVHGPGMNWQWYELLKAVYEVGGMTPCDLQIVVQWNRGGLIDPTWKHVNHLRNVHAFWQVIRNGPACISAFAPDVDFKPRTGELFATP